MCVSGIIAITRYKYSAKFIMVLNSNLGLHLVVPGIVEITEPRALVRVLGKLYSKTIGFLRTCGYSVSLVNHRD